MIADQNMITGGGDSAPAESESTESDSSPHPEFPYLRPESEGKFANLRRSHITESALMAFRLCPYFFRRIAVGENPKFRFHDGKYGHLCSGLASLFFGDRDRYAQEHRFRTPRFAAIVESCYESLLSHREVLGLCTGGVNRYVCRADDNGVPCQTRPQYVSHRGIVSLAVVADIDEFATYAHESRQVDMMAFRRRLIALAGGPEHDCYIIAVEARDPHRAGVWRIDPRSLDDAEDKNVEAIHALKDCVKTNVWPTHYEQIRTLTAE